ncbi:hypothetical protein PEC18_04100 [Paucibacter sp. O1-1]|nr:hypothetical protein [Paucibacter sp. O1-1]MDA3825056.1 hypothetical protein [Paucibacter sp. O1-1]
MTASELFFDDIVVGTKFLPHTFEIDQDVVNQFAGTFKVAAVPTQADANASWDAAVNPVLVASFQPMKHAFSWPTGVLHAKESIRTLGAIPVGSPLTAVVSIANKYEKNGRKFVEVNLLIGSGTPRVDVIEVSRTLVWPK